MRSIVRLLTTLVTTVTLSGLGAIAGPSAHAATLAPSDQHQVKIGQVVGNLTTAPAGPASVFCSGNVTIQSAANGLFVSTELGYTGGNYAMLRARASVVGPWELYTICTDTQTGISTIMSQANSRFVSAELGYTGGNYAMLRARASVVGPWEQFFLSSFGSNVVIQSAANGLFVSAELGYTGGNYAMLRARASQIGPWEQFQ